MNLCWPEPDICEDCCTTTLDDESVFPPERLAMLTEWATHYLWSATGERFSDCAVTLRPCARRCGDYWGGLPSPVRVDGEWVNLSCGSCRGACGCDTVSEVIVSGVNEIRAINIDGQEFVPEDTAVVYDRRRIVRIDGEAWPMCQNLSAPTGEPGSWSITVTRGLPVPPGAAWVTGILLCELAKACVGDSTCRLPRRVQTITRNGVTVGFQDMFEGLDSLRTGIFEVDMFIESARSVGYAEPRVLSPDVPRPSVQTWPVIAGGSL